MVELEQLIAQRQKGVDHFLDDYTAGWEQKRYQLITWMRFYLLRMLPLISLYVLIICLPI